MKKISFRNDILPLKNELYRLALRITLNPAEAEDVVQETMIKVWNRRDRWEEIDSIEAFCLTICRNISLDKMKKAENQNPSLEEGGDTADHSYSSNPESGGSSIVCQRSNAVVCNFVNSKARVIRKSRRYLVSQRNR